MLKDKNSCKMCIVKMPLEKIEKNKTNIIFFYTIHALIEPFLFGIAVPVNLIFFKKFLIDVPIYFSYIAILLFLCVLILFTILLFKDSGRVKNQKKITLLVNKNFIFFYFNFLLNKIRI